MSHCLKPNGLYSPLNFPGQNTGEGTHSLLQGIFPTQKLNQGFLHLQVDSSPLSYQESPSNI